jgi:hypothetical protein
MDLPSLLAGTTVSAEVRQAIDDLVAVKAKATERDVTPRVALLDALFDRILQRPEERSEAEGRPASRARVDALFRELAFSEGR